MCVIDKSRPWRIIYCVETPDLCQLMDNCVLFP